MTFDSEIFRHMQRSRSAQMSTRVNIILELLAFFQLFQFSHILSFRDMFTNLIIQKKKQFSTHMGKKKSSFGMLPWSLSCHSHIAHYP